MTTTKMLSQIDPYDRK